MRLKILLPKHFQMPKLPLISPVERAEVESRDRKQAKERSPESKGKADTENNHATIATVEPSL